MRKAFLLLLVLSLGACATTREGAARDPTDPYESFNRNVWAFNQAVDKAAIKPATQVYRTVTPIPARRGLSRVIANLGEPFSAINALLQGKPDRAFNSLGRFLINSTIGVGGLADHATDLGLPETREDFGQTLAQWGARESPYLVLPLFGPSTVRDGIGTAVRFVADPASAAVNSELSGTQQGVFTGLKVIDIRSQLIDNGVDRILDQSADPYAVARSAFLQRRRAELADQAAGSAAAENADDLLQRALDEEAGQTVDPPEDSQPKQ